MNIKRNILLNPGPSTTTDTVKLAQVVPDICPREKEFAALMRGLREDLLKIVHADSQKYTSVLFCGSGTLNIDVVLNSLLPENKKILVINNGAYSTRAAEICAYYGLPHIDLQLPADRPAGPRRGGGRAAGKSGHCAGAHHPQRDGHRSTQSHP